MSEETARQEPSRGVAYQTIPYRYLLGPPLAPNKCTTHARRVTPTPRQKVHTPDHLFMPCPPLQSLHKEAAEMACFTGKPQISNYGASMHRTVTDLESWARRKEIRRYGVCGGGGH